jgi:hypothetical protein
MHLLWNYSDAQESFPEELSLDSIDSGKVHNYLQRQFLYFRREIPRILLIPGRFKIICKGNFCIFTRVFFGSY